jgi:hypothetical protein
MAKRNESVISSLNGIVEGIRGRKNEKGEADVHPNERNATVKIETAMRLLKEVDAEAAAPEADATPAAPAAPEVPKAAPAKAAAK